MPLFGRNCQNHQPFSVAGLEITPDGAVEIVAVTPALLSIDVHFAQQAQMTDRCQSYVLQRELYLLTITGAASMAFSGQDG